MVESKEQYGYGADPEDFGYIRVSTKDQNEARQLAAMKPLNIPVRNLHIEKISGKNFTDRKEWQILKGRIRKGDTLYIKELDRLGRNKADIQAEWKELTDRGVYIVILNMPMLDMRNQKNGMDRLIAEIVLALLSYMAEEERLKTAVRRDEGIAEAKARGQKFGAPKKEYPELRLMLARVKAGELTAVEAQRQMGMKPNTYHRRVKELEEA